MSADVAVLTSLHLCRYTDALLPTEGEYNPAYLLQAQQHVILQCIFKQESAGSKQHTLNNNKKTKQAKTLVFYILG